MNDWEQAKRGELWALTRAGIGTNVWLRCRDEWRRVAPGLSGSVSPASAIQADSGYRLWPMLSASPLMEDAWAKFYRPGMSFEEGEAFKAGWSAGQPWIGECYFAPGSTYGAGFCHTHGEDHETNGGA